MINKKIILAFIPTAHWAILTVSLVLYVIGGLAIPLAIAGFNLFLFLLFVKIAVVLHEAGHLLFAALVGGRPRRVVFGTEHRVYQTEYKGIKLIVHSNFNIGLAYAAFDDLRNIRVKLFVLYCGGFVTNFIFSGVIYLIAGFSPYFADGIQLASIFIAANMLSGLVAIMPYRISYSGTRLSSDGLSILSIPFIKMTELNLLCYANELLDAYDLLEAKQYEQALTSYLELKKKIPNQSLPGINIGIAYLKIGEFNKSVDTFKELLLTLDKKQHKQYAHFVYNNLAWANLVMDNLKEADKYSELAYKLDPNTSFIASTRASVLIEKGEIEYGKNMLTEHMHFEYPNNQTLAAAMYIGFAELKSGKLGKANRYFNFVNENQAILDKDEVVLYNRIKDRVKNQSQSARLI